MDKTISENLKGCKFIQVHKQSKVPKTDFKGDDWNNKIISFEKANEVLKGGWNVGLVAGFGILLIDSDNLEQLGLYCEENLPPTYTEATTSGGLHHIFKTSDKISNCEVKGLRSHIVGLHLGEIRAERQFAVTAPSIAVNKRNELRPYEVIKDLPLAEITSEDIQKLLEFFGSGKTLENNSKISPEILKRINSEEEISKLFKGDLGSHPSRSEAELSLVSKLVSRDFTKEEIFGIMANCKIGKWEESHLSYRLLTYKKALGFVTKAKEGQEKFDRFEVSSFQDLMSFEPQPQSWLIEEQIPENEICLLVGKRGDKKTWTAIQQSLSLVSGKECFGNKVPAKRKVLIIDEEGGKNSFAFRLQCVARGMELDLKENLDLIVINFGNLKLDQRASPKYIQLLDLIEEFRPDLIIVDCLQRVCSFDIDKENLLISELFTGTIRPLMNIYKMSWLFIHHLRKSPTTGFKSEDKLDEVRGGSELTNYPRAVLHCSTPKYQDSNEDGSSNFVLEVIKMSNSFKPEPRVISFVPDSPNPLKTTKIVMEYVGRVEEVLKMEVRVANAIRDWLFNNNVRGEFKTGMLTPEKVGFGKTLVSKGLKELFNQGLIENVKRGVWKLKVDSQKTLGVSEEVVK